MVRHTEAGLLSMANAGANTNGSQARDKLCFALLNRKRERDREREGERERERGREAEREREVDFREHRGLCLT
jgi:hypothetical protein